MEISKIDQKNINNDENLPIFTQGGGGPFHLKTLFETQYPPLPVKKRNPGAEPDQSEKEKEKKQLEKHHLMTIKTHHNSQPRDRPPCRRLLYSGKRGGRFTAEQRLRG